MAQRILLLLLVLVGTPAWAVITATPSLPQKPKYGRQQILNGTGICSIASGAATLTNGIVAYTCGADGSKITGMIATSNDTAALTLMVFMVPASAKPYLLTTVAIPAGSGFLTTASAVNVFAPAVTPGLPLDSDRNPYLLCESGDTIVVGVKTTIVTSGLAIFTTVIAADF